MKLEPTLRALADPTRLRIMRLLADMELAVGELAQVLGQSQPRVSRHIKILCDAALAERRREGSWVFLRMAVGPDRAPPLGAAVARLLEAGEGDDAAFAARCAEDRRHLAAIRAAREEQAAAYFARHAAEWDTLRSLHSPDEPVEAALAAALGRQELGALLDVGTGTGRMAELFAARARQVTAVDKSPEMLRLARARLQHLPAGKVDLQQGDFTDLPFPAGSFDTVLFHQVLHYAQEPAPVLAEAARVTAPGGRIAVVDFAAHAHEELRSQHAHARLGFSDEQMLDLLTGVGFAPAAPLAIPGQPLTVKIWTGIRVGAVHGQPSLRKTLS
ncbi:metalloregulator ArsR/SmtB family transcription factor [Novosphingobium flavum]|uniref:Metalloregulator ArsR/SmtB family transcription factor n=1 Tax=Novosphingobium aerophilum TaxID=2839843 RepID=A0A7X1F7M7_9SPHN|nr:metalloregulator ArsR/SmtB family transcription factor [Novosphingobium aerophilum]MBC2651886.1 metalloregulator ArsR/SmtB family transcription factor [Novosphingobium aerophilum]MBC2661715.1 metalloregulator ArsR/SmtB family transcription factor [Novosphingobium aerophilum]